MYQDALGDPQYVQVDQAAYAQDGDWSYNDEQQQQQQDGAWPDNDEQMQQPASGLIPIGTAYTGQDSHNVGAMLQMLPVPFPNPLHPPHSPPPSLPHSVLYSENLPPPHTSSPSSLA